MAERPLIAIPARFSASASALRFEAEVAARKLVTAVYAAGGEPWVMHPHAPDGLADPAEVAWRLRRAAAVLLPGGGDLAAHWSGQAEHPSQYDVDLQQDAFDLAVGRVALDRGLPLLAVCRGAQVVNVLRGGDLMQDKAIAQSDHRHRMHTVVPTVESPLGPAGIRLQISCFHHQSLQALGADVRPIAHADDGTVEAFVLDGIPSWFLAVQWHPEDTAATDPAQAALFSALVAAATAAWSG